MKTLRQYRKMHIVMISRGCMDSIEKLLTPEMREEYKNDKYNFFPRDSQDLHPTFKVDGEPKTLAKSCKKNVWFI